MSNQQPTATWRVMQLELGLHESEERLKELAARELGLETSALRGLRVARKALDARVRQGVRRMAWIYHVDVVTDRKPKSRRMELALRSGRVREAPREGSVVASSVDPSLRHAALEPVVIVGAGPGGLFAAWALARNGVRAIVLDRGPAVEERGRHVVRFHRTRVVDSERNLLFGEGGAGTYSDGKIYTRVDDPLEVPILEELVLCGAPSAIVFDSLAHIGTDRLHRVLPRLRERLRAQGVEFRFETRMEELVLADGRVRAVRTSSGEVGCCAVILAPGHSARDTWRTLACQGIAFEAKPFQLGLRIEHPQELIDAGRFGARVPELGAASYGLLCKAGHGLPATFSFCMCPGGRIVASVNEPGLLCTNGMSNSRHSSPWATAAIVTTFGPREFGDGPFAGVAFQRELEQRFFVAGGSDYTAPAQGAQDFLAGRETAHPRRSTYTFGTRPGRLDQLLPPLGREAIARALLHFERNLRHFSSNEGQFVGLESRSSGPVRMPRDPATRRAIGWTNVYPVGEGAGHAGGIMSAALDGANSALALLRTGVGRG
ncbi:MAG: FAD-binding protein [Planctomycetes bacterium]|nr:FAD-binding protein [Planctomycetota bacterium]